MAYHKINQLVPPIAAGVPDAVSFPEQINTDPGMYICRYDLENAFSLYKFARIGTLAGFQIWEAPSDFQTKAGMTSFFFFKVLP